MGVFTIVYVYRFSFATNISLHFYSSLGVVYLLHHLFIHLSIHLSSIFLFVVCSAYFRQSTGVAMDCSWGGGNSAFVLQSRAV
jgi:phosphoglycerol transferase MdoB-like AlkP superfamily enzyme